MANLETECLRLKRELRQGRWRPGGYVTIRVTESKARLVSAAPFRDRVVHNALCALIGPILERSLLDDSSANRNRNASDNRNDNIGFRVASTLPCRSAWAQGVARRAGKRPGPAMMSEVRAGPGREATGAGRRLSTGDCF